MLFRCFKTKIDRKSGFDKKEQPMIFWLLICVRVDDMTSIFFFKEELGVDDRLFCPLQKDKKLKGTRDVGQVSLFKA
jgi:hypothetical protein